MTVSPRVVFLTDIPTPYMVAVLRELGRRVDLTAVFCAQSGSRGGDWAFGADLGFRQRTLGGLRVKRRSRDNADVYPTPRILGALVAERPAAVITPAFSFPTLSAAVYGAVTGAPFVIHSDGTAYSERSFGRVRRAARRLLLPRAAACVGNSAPAMDRFIELGAPPERVFGAPHATDIAPFQAVAAQRASRSGPLTVLHVGRLIPRKGVDRLLRAAATAAAAVPLRVVLVGSGPQEAALRRLAAELLLDVEFRGFVDQPGLPGVYAEADVFAFPTLDDPFGIVVLEAAASGLPIVASPFAGATTDVVRDGVNGFVAEPDDTAAWARALVALARDPELRRRLGEAAHDAVRDRTPERAAEGYAEAVDAVLARR
jgi:glycosyltransferase involved in cell wall biosynthesis